jgi:hypothetical protein
MLLKLYFVGVGDNDNALPTEEAIRKQNQYIDDVLNNQRPPEDYPNLLDCDWDDLDL